jgi:hypothetical protein
MIPSAFWGQSFVSELTRISAQAEKKTKVRRESMLNGELPKVEGVNEITSGVSRL